MDGMEELLDRIADAVAERVVQRLQGLKETYTVDDLIKRYGKSRSTINRLIAEGAFGEPIQLGERSRVVLTYSKLRGNDAGRATGWTADARSTGQTLTRGLAAGQCKRGRRNG